MIVLGLILLALPVALVVGVLVDNDAPVTVTAFGETVNDLSLGELFLAGAATGALALLGLWVLAAGGRRSRQRRVAARREVRDVRDEKEQLAQENADLRSRLLDEDPYPATGDERASARHARGGLFHRS